MPLKSPIPPMLLPMPPMPMPIMLLISPMPPNIIEGSIPGMPEAFLSLEGRGWWL